MVDISKLRKNDRLGEPPRPQQEAAQHVRAAEGGDRGHPRQQDRREHQGSGHQTSGEEPPWRRRHGR